MKAKILMYHSVGKNSVDEVGAELYCVSRENFVRQMRVLREGTVPLKRPVRALAGTVPTSCGDSPLITFDDGDITNYRYAYPILKDFGLQAYFFILVSKVGGQGFMNWEQIRQLRDAGMIIGSHGMTHRILTQLNDDELDYELMASKKFLEDNLGQAIDYFSVPRGFYNQKVIKKAKEAGYKAVFTSHPKDNNGFKFGRIPVKRNWEVKYFIKVVNNGLSFKDWTKEIIKDSSKRILGAKYYDKVRTRVLR